MKLTILQQDLIGPLQAVARSCGVKPSLPVLANILLQTDQGRLKLSATNLELGVIKKVKATISEEGEITVPARTFTEVISSLSGESLEIESSGEQLKVSTAKFNATLNGISATEFPAIPLASENSILVKADLIHKSLPEISFAAATDEGRPVLTGILTEIKDKTFELVATDGFRLAHKKIDLEQSNTSFRSIIPRRTFEEVVKLIAEDLPVDGQIEVSTSESQNQIIFKVGQTEVSSRLIEGQFPNWEKIIPTTSVCRATLERSELVKATKLASVFARGEAANIIKLNLSAGKLIITSEARELGTQETTLSGEIEGEDLTVAFNSKFLTEALANCSSSQILMEFSGNLSAALIKPVGEVGLEYVIMPVRLS